MKIFIKYHNKTGEILSVTMAKELPSGVHNPIIIKNENESALEVTGNKDLYQFNPLEIQNKYRINVKKKKLSLK